MHKWILIWALAALLGACSSPIKLNEVDVEDKSGQAAAAAAASGGMKSVAPAMASGTADKKSSVAGLDMTKDGKGGSSSASGKSAGSAGSAGSGSISVGAAMGAGTNGGAGNTVKALGATDAGRTIYFGFDSFVVRPEYKSILEESARAAKAGKIQRIVIEGHTDERGGREYNLALGQKRADAVRNELSLLGVDDSKIESVSFGKEKPAEIGEGESAMEKNRRAEIVIR